MAWRRIWLVITARDGDPTTASNRAGRAAGGSVRSTRRRLHRLNREILEAPNALPEVVLAAYARLATRIDDLLTRPASVERSPHAQQLLTAMVEDYLPTTLRTYAVLPPGFALLHRDTPGGPTPFEAVLRRLDLLEEQVVQLTHELCLDDLAAFWAHGRFLDARFGRSALDLGTSTPIGLTHH